MSFSIGIIGLPNAGKSTLFKALTKKKVRIEPRPFTTIQPNVSKVEVPDERLKKLAELVKPEKVTPTTIEFVDIAGLVKRAHLGEGLGNQFLGQIRNCNALIEVVRAFQDERVEHIEGDVNPQRDLDIIKTELLMKDFETLEKLVSKSHNSVLQKVKEKIAQGVPVSEISLDLAERKIVEDLQLLTVKSIMYILNIGQESSEKKEKPHFLQVNLKLEQELNELSEQERLELKMPSLLPRVILKCYELLDLISFYTIAGGKEVRSWSLKRGLNVQRAGGQVHSDFEERFIRAEVVNHNKLLKAGSWAEARKKGWIAVKGKHYLVEDGDVIEFKI